MKLFAPIHACVSPLVSAPRLETLRLSHPLLDLLFCLSHLQLGYGGALP
jgi:hypothetical protein